MSLILALTLLANLALHSTPAVRVVLQFIGRTCQEISIRADRIAATSDETGELLWESTGTQDVTLKASKPGIELKTPDKTIPASLVLRVESRTGEPLRLATPGKPARNYRGTLEIRQVGSSTPQLLVVNEVDLEQYLASVVPAEMPIHYAPEALKAQAVAARTYAVAHKNGHPAEFADLCDGTHCQLYTGADAERPQAVAALENTRGLVALWNGKPIQAQYSGDCGGYTSAGAGKGTPYLAAVRDAPDENSPDYCRAGPRHTWSLALKKEQIKALLARHRKGAVGEIQCMEIVEMDRSGRVRQLHIKGETGEICLSGDEFRRLLGLTVVPSTRFCIESTDSGWKLNGSGAGHGVGMCQQGANGLASPPYNLGYVEILQHYYQGIEVKPNSPSNQESGTN